MRETSRMTVRLVSLDVESLARRRSYARSEGGSLADKDNSKS
jgi:hypothetical protein